MEEILKIENLEKSFGSLRVLTDINLTVHQGEVVTVIGASGSGKSTMLRCINLLEEPDSGHIYFENADLTDISTDINKLREDIGMVFQSFNLFPNMNVLDNCTLAPMMIKKMNFHNICTFRNTKNTGNSVTNFFIAKLTSFSPIKKENISYTDKL